LTGEIGPFKIIIILCLLLALKLVNIDYIQKWRKAIVDPIKFWVDILVLTGDKSTRKAVVGVVNVGIAIWIEILKCDSPGTYITTLAKPTGKMLYFTRILK
jgi:hypothetical protein